MNLFIWKESENKELPCSYKAMDGKGLKIYIFQIQEQLILCLFQVSRIHTEEKSNGED